LSDDMGTAVAKQGDEAIGAWTRAENYWRAGSDRIERILQPLMDKRTPEIAFNAVMSGSRDGATALRSVMHSIRPSERGLIASTVLRRLGKANPSAQDAAGDVFSPETYLTNWNKLAPAARTTLFEGIDPMAAKDLTSLAKAAAVRRQAGNTLPNPSGTASNTAFWAVVNAVGGAATGALAGKAGTGAMMGAGGTLAAVGGSKMLAERVFTNPRMIRWLVKQNTIPYGAITQQAAILAKDAQKWPIEDRETALDLVDTLTNVDWRSLLLATATADAVAQNQQ
jgi:hypothetical protein